MDHIRNFCIIAHIDHGKSTLADRLLEVTGTVQRREMKEQVMDQMELERERGITIKAKSVRMDYTAKDGKSYVLNLIDTPGHVDFTYEVSKSLSSCEGAILVVDASQGVEAQTVANAHLAIQHNLVIFPVINKIDLPAADPEKAKRELEDLLAIDTRDVILASAKEGKGIIEILEAVVQKVPPPTGDPKAPLRALVFDLVYDSFRGVIMFVRVVDGVLKARMKVRLMGAGSTYEIMEVGVFKMKMIPVEVLGSGEVGYVVAGIRTVQDVRVGETMTDAERPAAAMLAGYLEAKSMVFCGLYPIEAGEYEILRDALDKMKLNDASFVYEPESSVALGFGYRCGFLGLLHMEIIQERLEREYGLNLIATSPGVAYEVLKTNGEVIHVESPSKLPPLSEVEEIGEPFIKSVVITPPAFLGDIMALCQDRRGVYITTEYLGSERAVLHYELPLNEVIYDFYDKLKSCSKGYASFDYQFLGYRKSDLVKLDMLVAGDLVDALSLIVHREKAYYRARKIVEKLKEVIPKQMFEVAIQAAIGSKVIARESIPALRKDVTAKLYGGDYSRKKKLLERQKEGKKRMKRFGQIDLPQEAFLAVLKVG